MGLLDTLAKKTGCTYLSDLRFFPRSSATLQRAVLNLPLADFQTSEWLDAAEYLCDVKCENGEEARNILLSFYCRGIVA